MSLYNSDGLAIAPGMPGSNSPQNTNAQNATMWAGIAQAAANVFATGTSLLPGVRENNLAIAQANADAAAAQAQAAAMQQPKSNTTMYVVAAIVIVLIIALLMRQKS